MKVGKLFSVLLICLLLVNYCNAKMWKVSSVNDIKNALSKCTPGDVLVMANGTWKDANIVFKASGTQQKPITLIAETPGLVVLTGQSRLNIVGKNLIVSGLYFNNEELNAGSIIHFDEATENCRLTNSAIVNDKAAGKENIKWIVFEGTRNRLDHSFFKNKLSLGPLISVVVTKMPNYHIIDSNYFGYRAPQGFNGAEIMRIGLGYDVLNSFTTVAYNYFEDCDGENEIISSKSSNNVFKFNTFKRCQGTLSLRQGNNNIVEGNYFLGEGVPNTGGVKLFGENHKIVNNYFSGLGGKNLYAALVIMNGTSLQLKSFDLYRQVKNVTIENNTFVDNNENIVMGFNYGDENTRNLAPDSLIFNNNIFYKSKENIIKYQSKPQNVKWSKNIVYGANLGMDIADGFVSIDPKLQQSSNGIWQTTQASPEIVKARSSAGTEMVNARQTSSESISSLKPQTGNDVGPTFLANILDTK